MFGVKERRTFDKSANFFNEPGIGTFGNIRSILIVDEDRDVLNQLSQSFAICAKQNNIYLAQNGRDAPSMHTSTSVQRRF